VVTGAVRLGASSKGLGASSKGLGASSEGLGTLSEGLGASSEGTVVVADDVPCTELDNGLAEYVYVNDSAELAKKSGSALPLPLS
jgi:hypothetical protein